MTVPSRLKCLSLEGPISLVSKRCDIGGLENTLELELAHEQTLHPSKISTTSHKKTSPLPNASYSSTTVQSVERKTMDSKATPMFHCRPIQIVLGFSSWPYARNKRKSPTTPSRRETFHERCHQWPKNARKIFTLVILGSRSECSVLQR
jgi:hypothetical protein